MRIQSSPNTTNLNFKNEKSKFMFCVYGVTLIFEPNIVHIYLKKPRSCLKSILQM